MSSAESGTDEAAPPPRSAFTFGGDGAPAYFESGSGARSSRGSSPHGPKSPRRRLARMPVALGALALVAAAGLAYALLGGSGSTAPGPALSSGSLAQAAYETSQAAGFKMHMSITGDIAGQSVTMEADGALDERAREGSMMLSVAGQQVQELVKDPYVYVRLPAGAGALSGGKPWVRANLDDYTKAFGASSPFQSNPGRPTQMLSMLDASGQVTELGSEQVRGVDTTHYRANVDLASYIAKADPSQKEAIHGYAQLLEHLLGGRTMPVEVWVDAQHQVRRFAASIDGSTPAGTLQETVSMEMYDFGAQPSVTAPAESEVTDVSSEVSAQASQALRQLGG